MDASPDYYTQLSFFSPSMEKTRYSRTKTDLNNMKPQTQPYRKYQKENHKPRKPTTPIITQASDNPPPAQLKEGKHTNTTTKKITRVDNHWSLISLNINRLNSPIKRHRLEIGYENRIQHSAVYKKHTATTKIDTYSE